MLAAQIKKWVKKSPRGFKDWFEEERSTALRINPHERMEKVL